MSMDLSKWRIEKAELTFKDGEQEILKLDTLSDRHPPYKKEPWLSRGLRFFPVGNFLVFYIT